MVYMNSTHEPTGSESRHLEHLDNPVRGRVNAWMFRILDGYIHKLIGDRKQRLFSELPDTVVELGSGCGANFRYLRAGTRVIAVEPNVHMHGPLEQSARRHGIEVEVRPLSAERLPFEDASVDAVVATLVLCTVPDPVAAVREVLRVLKPGGRFICIEHVAAPAGGFVARLQRILFRPWRWFFEGCHLYRDTGSLLETAGFTSLTVERYEADTLLFLPVRPQVAVTAYK
jgi:ubiquinone/menaquinone biosynthesis C-methylase UbiE